jgi:hypothetical protein
MVPANLAPGFDVFFFKLNNIIHFLPLKNGRTATLAPSLR